MSTPPPPPAGGGKGLGSLAAKAGGRRNILIAAAVGTAAVAWLMARAGGGASSSDDEGGGGSGQIMLGYDSGPYDQYNGLQNQLEDLQRQIDEGRVVPGTPTPPPPTAPAPKPPITIQPWPKNPPTAIRPPIPSRPNPKPPTATKPKRYVTIAKGDTLSEIAQRAKISMTTLKKLNPNFWSNPKYNQGNTIWSGGKVRIA